MDHLAGAVHTGPDMGVTDGGGFRQIDRSTENFGQVGLQAEKHLK